ncbi:MAG: putative lipid II flippase FtsW [Chromatiales bacterium]
MNQAAPQALPRTLPRSSRPRADYDPWLAGCFVLLLALGLVMVASASVTIADRDHHDPFYFLWRQMVAAMIGLSCCFLAVRTPLATLERLGALSLFLALLLLTAVLVPGLGRVVNGSMRWIRLGPVSFQASEPAKLFVIIYVASYLVRHEHKVRSTFAGMMKPFLVLTLIGGLLLLEPDYGVTAVLFATALGMLFLGGVPLTRFLGWGAVAVTALVALAMLAPYRLDRLMTFMDPWADPYDRGFQLTQALIAIGRGEWWGVGLGGSIQKLFYLPEAHTDFIFAVLAEELGLIGSLVVIAAYTLVLWRAVVIGGQAQRAGQPFAEHLAYGIGLLIGLQGFINMGVNMGVLPTKGLTLPLVSYGGNSMMVTCAAFGILFRVEREARVRRDGG